MKRILKIIAIFIGLKLNELVYVPIKFIVKIPYYIVKGIINFGKWLVEISPCEVQYNDIYFFLKQGNNYRNYVRLIDNLSFGLLVTVGFVIYMSLVLLCVFALMHIFTEFSFGECFRLHINNESWKISTGLFPLFIVISTFLVPCIGVLIYKLPSFIRSNIQKAISIVDKK